MPTFLIFSDWKLENRWPFSLDVSSPAIFSRVPFRLRDNVLVCLVFLLYNFAKSLSANFL